MEHLTFQSFDEYGAAIQHAVIRVTLSSRQQANWALDYLSLGDMNDQLKALGISVGITTGKHSVLSPSASENRLRVLIEGLGTAASKLPDGFWSTSASAAAKKRVGESVRAIPGFQNEIAILPGRHTLSRTEITRTALRILDEHVHEHLPVYRLASMIGIQNEPYGQLSRNISA